MITDHRPIAERHPIATYDDHETRPEQRDIATETQMGTTGLTAALMEQDLSGERIETQAGTRLQYHIYFDGDNRYDDLTERVVVRRKEKYVEKDIWRTTDVKDPVRSNGHVVEFEALLDETGNPVASLRKIHPASNDWEGVQGLPSFIKTASVIDVDAAKRLREIAKNKQVDEMGAAYNDGSGDVMLALYGLNLRDSIVNEVIWFMGVVTPLYRQLRLVFGDEIIQTMGEGVLVGDGLAKESVMIHPIYVEPVTVIPKMLDRIETARTAKDGRAEVIATHVLKSLLKQLNFDKSRYLGDETMTRIAQIEELPIEGV